MGCLGDNMDIEKFDVVEVNNNKFIVINKIEYNDNTYLYLMNEDEEKDDVAIVKVIKNEDNYEFVTIEDEKDFEIVIDKLIIDNKEELKTLLDN